MSRLRWIEINLDAIAHNTRATAALLGPQVKISAVVKADAYGHGAAPVAKTALKNGADTLAVTYIDEGRELRRAGIKAPVLVMGATLPEQATEIVKNHFDVMIDNAPLLRALSEAAVPKHPIPVHVKVNLGLSRWGIPLADLPTFVRQVRRTPGLTLAGVFSHPGYMAGKNGARVETSVREFLTVAQGLPDMGDVDIHVADSAVALDFPQFLSSRARIGNLLYGINPTKRELALKNPWKVCARLVHIENLSVGQAVGYGSEYVATRAMRVGTLPVGYAHGLTLEPASRWIQLVSGQTYWGTFHDGTPKKCPFVGRVGMSHCLVDLTDAPNAKVGDTLHLPLRRTAASNWEKVYN